MMISIFRTVFGVLFVPIYLFIFSDTVWSQTVYSNGDGSLQNPYQISNSEQLDAIRYGLSSHYVLNGDIDIEGAEWSPIGNGTSGFLGSLNGAGFIIKNFTIGKANVANWEDGQNIGLFAFMDTGSKIFNLSIANAEVSGLYEVGLLVGRNDGGIIENIRVSGSVSGDGNVGGVAGLIRFNAIVKDSYSNATVKGNEQAGGVVGNNYQAAIENVLSEATVLGSSSYGGIVGSNSGLLKNSSSTANVSGIISWSGGIAGGVVGSNYGEIINSHSRNSVIQGTNGVGGLAGSNSGKIFQSSSVSIIQGTSYYVGGLVGMNNGEIDQCYSVADVSGHVQIGGLVGANGETFGQKQAIISNSYAIGDVRATSVISGSNGSFIGGIIGQEGIGYAQNVYFIGRIENPILSFLPMGSTVNAVWNSSLIPNITQSGGTNVVGLNESELRDINNYTKLGWDFGEIWDIADGGFPFLRNVQTESLPGLMNNWIFEVKLTLEEGFYVPWQSVLFGHDQEATDEYDADIDIALPPASPSNGTRILIKNVDMNSVLGDVFQTDVRATKDLTRVPEGWRLEIEKPESGALFLEIRRPLGLDLPFSVFDGIEWHLVRYGDLALTLFHNGADNQVLYIFVGDLTPPKISLITDLSGSIIWDATVNREISWNASDENHLESVNVEVSTDLGETWSVIYTGLDSVTTWTPPQVDFNDNILFRLTATDRVGLKTHFKSDYPITIASPSQRLNYEPGWQLVGVPFRSVDLKSSSLQSSVLRFEWNGTDYNRISAYDPIRAHWLGSQVAGEDTIVGSIAESDQIIYLHTGWNMITSPLVRPVFLDSIIVTNLSTNEILSYTQAIVSTWITIPFDYRDKTYNSVSKLNPFKGYWVGVSVGEGVSLTLPIHRQTQPAGKQPSTPNPQLWFTLRDGASAHELSVSVSQAVPAPPAAPNSTRVGLLGPASTLGSLYLQVKAQASTESAWPLVIGGEARTVELSWTDQDFAGMTAVLQLSDRRYDLTSANSISLRSDKSAQIVVGPISTSVEPGSESPLRTELLAAYPNPFNPSTMIDYELSVSGNVRMAVYDVLGRQVAVLLNGEMSAGRHQVNFDASNLASGIYLYRLEAGGRVFTRRLTLLK